MAIAGEPAVLLDNVAGTLGGSAFDACLTATEWSDRILGRSEMATGVPLFATWFASGNNIVLLGDTARRTLHVRLESPEETPEERSGFRHPDLLQWVRQERARLVKAALTILAAYFGAGRPDLRLKPWGSFEKWSELIRNALVWSGLPDPGETRQELTEQADVETRALRLLIDGWSKIDPEGCGLSIGSVLDAIAEYQKKPSGAMPEDYEQVRNGLSELVPAKSGGLPTPRSVGMKLHHLRRRVVDGRYLDRRPHSRGSLWLVRTLEAQGTRGTKDTNPGYPMMGKKI